MKRSIALILLICILLLCGCNPSAPSFQQPVSFYCLSSEELAPNSSVFAVQTAEGAAFSNDAAAMLNAYFRIQGTEDTRSPFPYGLQTKEVTVSDNEVTLTVSRQLGSLEGIDLTLACACITLTLCEYLNVHSVTIFAENTTLGGKASITMTKDSLFLRDTTPEHSAASD